MSGVLYLTEAETGQPFIISLSKYFGSKAYNLDEGDFRNAYKTFVRYLDDKGETKAVLVNESVTEIERRISETRIAFDSVMQERQMKAALNGWTP